MRGEHNIAHLPSVAIALDIHPCRVHLLAQFSGSQSVLEPPHSHCWRLHHRRQGDLRSQESHSQCFLGGHPEGPRSGVSEELAIGCGDDGGVGWHRPPAREVQMMGASDGTDHLHMRFVVTTQAVGGEASHRWSLVVCNCSITLALPASTECDYNSAMKQNLSATNPLRGSLSLDLSVSCPRKPQAHTHTNIYILGRSSR